MINFGRALWDRLPTLLPSLRFGCVSYYTLRYKMWYFTMLYRWIWHHLSIKEFCPNTSFSISVLQVVFKFLLLRYNPRQGSAWNLNSFLFESLNLLDATKRLNLNLHILLQKKELANINWQALLWFWKLLIVYSTMIIFLVAVKSPLSSV